jgi:hypothetical protein
LLEFGWTGNELVSWIDRSGGRVSCECSETGEKRLKAVHRKAVGRRAVSLFGDCGRRALGFGDDAGPECFGGRLIGVAVEHQGEALTEMPFNVIGEHAQKDVSAHARRCPVEDRKNLQINSLDAANGAFDLGEAFIGPDLRIPLISNEPINIGKERLLERELAELLHQRS